VNGMEVTPVHNFCSGRLTAWGAGYPAEIKLRAWSLEM